MAAAENNGDSITKVNTHEGADARNLQLAAMKGDWKSAQFSQVISRRITKKGETALHIAAIAEQVDFVKKLVNEQNVEYLIAKNDKERTALSYAATTGNVKVAKVMVEKLKQESPQNGVNINEQLVQPLIIAAQFGHGKMVKYLRSECEVHRWSEDEQFKLFVACIETSLYDVAARLLEGNQNLAQLGENDQTALLVLASMPSACDGASKLGMWMKYISPFKKERHNLVKELCKHAFSAADGSVASSAADGCVASSAAASSSNATDVENPVPKILSLLFRAAEVGNLEVLIELIHFDPEQMWIADKDKGTIFHIAVRRRHESIFGLLSDLGSTKYLIAQLFVEGKNNILHLAAKLAPREKVNVVSGAALQMQRALLWFTEVEKIVPQSYKHMKNSRNMTPQALFEKKHKKLRMEGEKWMKATATSSTVVAALIATIMFGAAFNVPGGFHDPSGEPNLQKKKLFLVFFISDALSLFWSSSSALMFLSILTSRYANRDFLWKLPFKLMIGVTLLFLSMTTMMVAFYATFLLYYQDILGLPLRLTFGGIYASVPILYFSLKYSLLVDLFYVIFKPRSLFQPPKRLLY